MMDKLRDLREWYWEKTNGIFEKIGREWRVSRSNAELQYNLEKREVYEEVKEKVETEGCRCGEAQTIEDLTAVSKNPAPANGEEYKLDLFCKECFG